MVAEAVQEHFSIAHVSPYPWEAPHEVNAYVLQTARELSRRGHRILILAPSRSPERVRAARRTLRGVRDQPELLLAEQEPGQPLMLAVGEVLDMPAGGARTRPSALPIDVARTIDELLASLPLDVVHVHEPFAPSASSSALRQSRSLNVGSFHSPTERLLTTQVARRFVQTFFGRLDARTASYGATAQLMERHFPAEYQVVLPGTGNGEQRRDSSEVESAGDPAQGVRLLLIEREERSALRLFLRALGRLQTERSWSATIVSPRGESSASPLRSTLRERVRFLTPQEISEEAAMDWADVIVCASEGGAPAPGLLLEALAEGVAPVASRLPVYEELLADGARGLIFEPRDVLTLAAQLERLIEDHGLRAELVGAGSDFARDLTWVRVAGELESLYGALAARRRDPEGDRRLHRRLSSRPLIEVDLHMHTDHSGDCATPVEVLLGTAREQGLGAIAVTDHNEISGALRARELAAGTDLKVIVGEEVKTHSQGEVIGLFIERKIPRGLSLAETVAEIKRQGGLVYVPHPFDRLHSVPDYEHLLGILEEIDAIEVFNPRVAIGTFNEEAARFAAKYRIVAGAGSDSHVAHGLGSVRIRMRDFEGPDEFLQSLREADIVTRPTSLLYVQALKFLQTRATTPRGRRQRRARARGRAERREGRKS